MHMSGHPPAIVPCQRKRGKRKQQFFKSVLKRALFFSKKGSGRVFLLNEDLKFPEWEYNSMVYQPYRLKPSFSAKRIYQWYDYFDGKIYVSFSGGLDSTILSFLVCQTYREYRLEGPVRLVFSDTGTEFPEVRAFTCCYVEWLKKKFPEQEIDFETIRQKEGWNFKRVCSEKGFPILSKDTANKIWKLRYGKLGERYRNYLLHGDERGKFGMLAARWQYLADKKVTPFDISSACCKILKIEPFRRYHKRTGNYPMLGITQDESLRRKNLYRYTGCNVYEGTAIKSQPIAFWTRQDVLRFKEEHQIPICSVYGNVIRKRGGCLDTAGEKRTGCILCGFGCQMEKEPNRIQRLSVSPVLTHRRIYEWGMQLENNGITYQEALEHCGIPTRTWESEGQMNLIQFPQIFPENSKVNA